MPRGLLPEDPARVLEEVPLEATLSYRAAVKKEVQ
jgi:hypothetical protein